MIKYDENIRELVKKRLSAMPPDISFSIGNYGDFTPEQLKIEIDKNTPTGRATIEMQLEIIKQMPKLRRMVELQC